MLTDARKLTREVFGLFLLFCGLYVLLSLVTHNAADPSINHVLSGPEIVQNNAGLVGAYISGFLNDIFGIGAYVWPLVLGAVGAACISTMYELVWWRWLGYFILTLCLLFVGAAWNMQLGHIQGGGMIGKSLYLSAALFLNPAGSSILWIFCFIVGTQLAFGFSWLQMCKALIAIISQKFQENITETNDINNETSIAKALPAKLTALMQSLSIRKKEQHTKALPEMHLNIDPIQPTEAFHNDAPSQASTEKAPTYTPSLFAQDPPAHEEHVQNIIQQQEEVAPSSLAQKQEHRQTVHVYEQQDASENQTHDEHMYEEHAYDSHAHDNHAYDDHVYEKRVYEKHEDQDDFFAPQNHTSPLETHAHVFVEEEFTAPLQNTKAPASAPTPVVEQETAYASPIENKAAQSSKTTQPTTYIDDYAIEDTSIRIVPAHEAHQEEYIQTHSNEVPQKSTNQIQPQTQVQQQPVPITIKPTPTNAPSAITGATPRKQRVPLPPMDLLQKGKTTSHASREAMEARGKALVECLANFGIQGELVRITPGPVVTMYEVRPAAGIRVARIANLSDDLALSLKAIAIRIQAPIPGSDTVGIEIPNVQRDIVNFREILESPEFTQKKAPLNMALGKNIAGNPFVADLSLMPHLLVAGATGAGKSVGLNSILLSFLYSAHPDEVQLLLIDPKRIEMAVYADLPHLVHPVVTEMQHAKTALEWAVHEMDRRYTAMTRLSVRNILGYNEKLRSYGNKLPPTIADLEPLPYLVIIIDELADLMLTAGREVETSIVRLAQLARAAGIHMILATQRPSVDVVTGLIKANFPCRISFQVTSKHDSRTILDMVGAEHLLGKGDMLYKPSGGRLMRLHGPFVPDEEVHAVVEHWKRHLPPAYKVDFAQWGSDIAEVNAGGSSANASDDALYNEVRAFVEEQGKASISLIQRRFRIGFNRAACLVEQLERDGIISPADGSKPRSVIR